MAHCSRSTRSTSLPCRPRRRRSFHPNSSLGCAAWEALIFLTFQIFLFSCFTTHPCDWLSLMSQAKGGRKKNDASLFFLSLSLSPSYSLAECHICNNGAPKAAPRIKRVCHDFFSPDSLSYPSFSFSICLCLLLCQRHPHGDRRTDGPLNPVKAKSRCFTGRKKTFNIYVFQTGI